MDINGISNSIAISAVNNANHLQSDDSFAAMLNQLNSVDTSSASKQDPAVTNFMNYMNESPEERFIDSWLTAHHLTRDDLAKMDPEKREAIMKQIAEDMKRAIKDKIQEKSQSTVNLSA